MTAINAVSTIGFQVIPAIGAAACYGMAQAALAGVSAGGDALWE